MKGPLTFWQREELEKREEKNKVYRTLTIALLCTHVSPMKRLWRGASNSSSEGNV
jgi:hypothetical protein